MFGFWSRIFALSIILPLEVIFVGPYMFFDILPLELVLVVALLLLSWLLLCSLTLLLLCFVHMVSALLPLDTMLLHLLRWLGSRQMLLLVL